jgi:hypothetical protein
MLLESTDNEREIVPSLLSWDSTFTKEFQRLMEPFGWRVEMKEKQIHHVPPCSSSWKIVRTKAHPFRYSSFLYNPYFEMYFKNHLVGHIKVDVEGWSTFYNFWVDVCFIQALPLVEKLPFDGLVRTHIADFLLSKLKKN